MTTTQTTQVTTETGQDMDKDLMSKTSQDKGSASCSGNATSASVPEEGMGETMHLPVGKPCEEVSGPQLSSGDGTSQSELYNIQNMLS